MDKKDAKKLEELYHQENAYALRTFEEIESELRRCKSDFDKSISDERQKINFEEGYRSIYQLKVLDKAYAEKLIQDIGVLGIVQSSTLDWILTNGIYAAYKTDDMSMLKNALHTKNRLKFGMAIQSRSGYNHSGRFEQVADAFADCDIDLVKKYLPEQLGLADSKTHPFLRVASNLVMSMVYGRPEWLPESMALAEKFCGQKSSSKNDVLVAKYIMALAQQNVSEASLLLQEVANNYRKMAWLFEFKNEFLKFFGVFVHGLYNMGYFVLPAEKFELLKEPEHSVFWLQFSSYTRLVGFSKGQLMLNLDGNIEGLKRLFEDGWQ